MDEGSIRRAASVIATRKGDPAPEVLVVERAPGNRFLPGYVAFPGGAVDDADAGLASRWFGDPTEAPRATAVRELIEEVGLAVTADGIRPADRSAGAAESLREVDGSPPAAEQLVEIGRWIAPEDVPVRFDAHYFVVEVLADAQPIPDGSETSAAWWVSPATLLAEWEAGRRRLYWPTWFTVSQLAACGSVEDLASLRLSTREPDDAELERLPASVFWQDAP